MADKDNVYMLNSISHGANTLDSPVGGQIQEQITFLENRPGNRVCPVLAIQSYGVQAGVKFQDMETPIVRGTKETLTFTCKKVDHDGGGTKAVAVTNMRAGGVGFDFNTPPFAQTQDFVYDSGASDDLAPISVT